MTDDQPQGRTMALVLDTSAISAFMHGSLAVGEILTEIDDDHGAALIPLPCLIEAAALYPDGHAWIDVLLAHPTTVVISDNPEDWRMVANLRLILGGYEPAFAAWLALEADVDVMTRNADLYTKLDGGSFTLPFDD